MATAKYNPGVNSSNPYAVLTVTESSYSVENNTSKVSWNLKIYRPYAISSSAPKSYKVVINGSTVASGTTTIGGTGTKTIASGTTTVNHNTDGSKTISFNFTLDFNITWSGTWVGTGSASGSLKLTTIPRATTPVASASSVYMGNSVTFTLDRASTSFTHKLTYKIGSKSGTIGTDIATSKSWTVPESLATAIPSATSGTCTITCTTYKDGSTIGTKSITITLKVKASVIPTVTVSVSEAVSNIAEKAGVYVKSLSKLNISAVGSGVQGSAIKSYKIVANGATYNKATVTTGFLTTAGNVTVTVTVTDSRGRTATTTATIYVYDYSKPCISFFSVDRCDSDGTINDEGGNVLVKIKSSVSDLASKNTGTYTLKYNKVGDSNTITQVLASGAMSYNNDQLIIEGINTDYPYDFSLAVSDLFSSNKSDLPIGTAFTLVDYHSTGTGLAIGKVANEPGVIDINLPLLFREEWHDLTLADGFTVYGNAETNKPQYKQIGNLVMIKGVISPTATITSSTSSISMLSGLPSEARPTGPDLQYICQGSALNKWLCTITTGGAVKISRYGDSDYVNPTASTWLPINILYMV